MQICLELEFMVKKMKIFIEEWNIFILFNSNRPAFHQSTLGVRFRSQKEHYYLLAIANVGLKVKNVTVIIRRK